MLSSLWKIVNPNDNVCPKKKKTNVLVKQSSLEVSYFSPTRYLNGKIPKGFIWKTHHIGFFVILSLETSYEE